MFARGRRNVPLMAGAVGAVLAVLIGLMYLYDHSRREVIANGVRIDGIAVGGLNASKENGFGP